MSTKGIVSWCSTTLIVSNVNGYTYIQAATSVLMVKCKILHITHPRTHFLTPHKPPPLRVPHHHRPPLPSFPRLHLSDKYTLRYTGGLVPDAYQLFTKKHGVFSNPTTPSSPAKLRMVFEAAPVALLVEAAGGATSDGVTGGRSV